MDLNEFYFQDKNKQIINHNSIRVNSFNFQKEEIINDVLKKNIKDIMFPRLILTDI